MGADYLDAWEATQDAIDAHNEAAKALTFSLTKRNGEYVIVCSNGVVVPVGFTKREADKLLRDARRNPGEFV